MLVSQPEPEPQRRQDHRLGDVVPGLRGRPPRVGGREGTAKAGLGWRTRACDRAARQVAQSREVATVLAPVVVGARRARAGDVRGRPGHHSRRRRVGDVGRLDRRERAGDRVGPWRPGDRRGGASLPAAISRSSPRPRAARPMRSRSCMRNPLVASPPPSVPRSTARPGRRVAPSADERGTSLLLLRPPFGDPQPVRPRFVPSSPRGGGGAGLPTAVVERDELSFDVDEPGDILPCSSRGTPAGPSRSAGRWISPGRLAAGRDGSGAVEQGTIKEFDERSGPDRC